MIQEFVFGDLQYFTWLILIGSLITFVLTLFVENEKTVEENLRFINQISLYLFGSLIIVTTQIMFSKAPSLSSVFAKSIFIPISQEEQIKINQLQIPTFLILLNSIFIAAFSYFGIKVVDDSLKKFANFQTQSSEYRREYLSQIRKKYLTKKGLIDACKYVSFFIMISLVFRSCTL